MKKVILFLGLILSTLSFASPKTIVRVFKIDPQEKLEVSLNKIVAEEDKKEYRLKNIKELTGLYQNTLILIFIKEDKNEKSLSIL